MVKKPPTPRTDRETITWLCYWALIGFFLLEPGWAQPAELHPTFYFEQISTEEGLAGSGVACIFQDKTGFMWFGTSDGLSRYDGYHFRTYIHEPKTATSLSENSVTHILQTKNGDLWLGTNGGGLNYFDMEQGQFFHYRHDPADPQSPSSDKISCLLEDEWGAIWIGTRENGLTRLAFDKENGPVFERFDLDAMYGPGHGAIHAMIKDPSGRLLIGTGGGGLFWIQTRSVITVREHEGWTPSEKSPVTALARDRNGSLWIGTENGLYRRDTGRGDLIRFPPKPNDPHGLSDEHTTCLLEDRSGTIWIGTQKGGVNRYDPAQKCFETYRPEQGNAHALSYHHITTLFEDRSGVLWFGTRERGVNKLSPDNPGFGHLRLIDQNGSVLPLDVISILEDSDQTLWIGTPHGLMEFSESGKLMNHYRADDGTGGLSDNFIWTLFRDSKGILWAGTKNGLNRAEKRKAGSRLQFTSFKKDLSSPASLSHNGILCIAEDRNQDLWIGTSGGGLNRFDRVNQTFKSFRYKPGRAGGLSDDMVTRVLQDRGGNLWVGTYTGLNRFDPKTETFRNYAYDVNNPSGLSHNRVLSMLEDRFGRLWIGVDGGLNRYNPETDDFTRYWKEDGLPNEVIYGILEDDEGYLWLSTNRGLAQFDAETEHFSVFDARDGLQANEFQFGAYAKGSGGRLYFGGINGLNAFLPEDLEQSAMPPPLVLTDFLLFNLPVSKDDAGSPLATSIEKTQEIMLTHRDYVFTFEFSALDYADPGKSRYAYILKGLDNQWTYTDATRRFATYTNLDPGTYTFQVKGAGKNGVWNDEGATVRLTVLPPPWLTWWAITLYYLAGITVLVLYIRSHRRKLAKERTINEELDRKVGQRTLALQEKNREILEKKQQLENQAAKLEEQARQLRQLDELKTKFFTNISHELRTPLTLALGPLEDIFSEGVEEEILGKRLDRVRRNVRHLQKLIDELLDISKLDAGRMPLLTRKIDIIPFFRKCVDVFTPLSEQKGISLFFQTDCDTLPIFIDPDKIEKVIFNLLSNSFKFTGEKGKVMIDILGKDPNEVRVSVRDTGTGIPEEQIPFVFNRFFQVPGRDASQGTGIGLALVKELVHLHGGEIEVESKSGFGCAFTIRLPKGKDYLNEQQISDASEALPDLKYQPIEVRNSQTANGAADPKPVEWLDTDDGFDGRQVLVIDDHEEIRAYLREHLAEEYLVLEAKNGELGLALARKHIPDLVLSDVMMPGIDGFEVCRSLKNHEKTSHIPVILLTARASHDYTLSGFETGADDYIVKPFHSDILLTRIRNLIETRRLLRERYSGEMILKPSQIAITPADQAFLEKTIAVLEAHMHESHFGVFELAEELGFSRRQFHRKIKAVTDRTPGDFIRHIRLQRAADLLKNHAGNVSEIAYAVGFNKPRYFSHIFRETFGKNPSEYAS